MMLFFALLMAALIFLRLILPLRIRMVWKILLAFPVLAACCKNQVMHQLGGPMFFAPDLPAWILLPAAWVYAAALLLFVLLVLMEPVRLIIKIVFYCRKIVESAELERRIWRIIHPCLAAAAVLLASIGIFRGTSLPSVREVTLSFPNLPLEADGFRIAVLADLHADRVTRSSRVRKMVELTNTLNPDMTVILGDFVDGPVERCSQELVPLRDLRARLGIYAVPGNHEYYSGYASWMNFLSGLGLRMLENSCVRLSCGIRLAGVTDPAAARTGEGVPDLKKALHGVPAGDFILLLAHRPALAEEASRQGVSLQLSGHTHGGMVFGLDRVVARFNGGFVSGLYEVNGMKLYVSNGTGIWNGFPVRLGRESEITLITLCRDGISR